jgi:hypothetical protein
MIIFVIETTVKYVNSHIFNMLSYHDKALK